MKPACNSSVRDREFPRESLLVGLAIFKSSRFKRPRFKENKEGNEIRKRTGERFPISTLGLHTQHAHLQDQLYSHTYEKTHSLFPHTCPYHTHAHHTSIMHTKTHNTQTHPIHIYEETKVKGARRIGTCLYPTTQRDYAIAG